MQIYVPANRYIFSTLANCFCI